MQQILRFLSAVAKLDVAAFDINGKVLAKSGNFEPLAEFFTAENNTSDPFLRRALSSTSSRNELVILKGPFNQYCPFFPVQFGTQKIIFLLGSFFTTSSDLDQFFASARREGTHSEYERIHIRDFDYIQSMSEGVQLLVSQFITMKYLCVDYERQCSLLKTVLGILTSVSPDLEIAEIYRLITDFPLLMIEDLNTISFSFFNDDLNSFITKVSSGNYSGHVNNSIFYFSGPIEEVYKYGKYKFVNDLYSIHRMGLNEQITSIHIFPVKFNEKIIGIINIYNSPMSKQQIEIMEMFSKVIGYLTGTGQLKENHTKVMERISNLYSAVSMLDPTADQDQLFNNIIDSASRIVKADRASLMLLDGDILRLRAGKGLNMLIASGIKIKIGEPVAGKILASKSPLMIRDASRELSSSGKFRNTYKTKSFISIPLIVGVRAIGVLNVADKTSGASFCEEDFNLLKSFASYAAVIIESSNYHKQLEEMRELSITDSLTGIFNRRYFNDRLKEEIQRSERHGFSFALALADIDNFKLFNDSEGHLSGDAALKTIANIIKESLRTSDILARFGGEEFAVIFPQTDRAAALQIAERIREDIKNLCPKFWKKFPADFISISLGIAHFPYDGSESKELIRNADKALYTAKMQGKDRTVLYSNQTVTQ